MSEILQNAAHDFRLLPREAVSSPTAKVVSRAGVTLEEPSATPDAVATTVASATAADVLVLASTAGVLRGRVYRITGVWGEALAEVSRVDGSTVHLVDPLPAAPSAGDLFVGAEVAVTVSATGTGQLGEAYRLIVTEGSNQVVATFDVARTPFVPPLTARDVRTYVVRLWPGETAKAADDAWMQRIADQANEELRARLRAAQRYVYRCWDHALFRAPAMLAARLILADEHALIPRNQDPTEYIRGLRFELNDAVARLIAGTDATARYDGDDDGVVTDDEVAEARIIRVHR